MLPSTTSIVLLRGLLAALLLAAAAPAGAPMRADEADDQFAVAAGHYAQQRWKLAVEEFEKYLQQYPDHPKASQGVFLLAEAQLQAGNTSDAEARFREYLQREPGGTYVRAALFRAGETAHLAGKADAAKTDLERFRALYPDDSLNAYVLPYLGDIALGQGRVAEAADLFRTALGRFPQGRLQDDCRFGLARALEKQGETQEAQRLYLAVAAKQGSPLADDAQFHLGALQYALGRYAEAVESFAAFEVRLAESPFKSSARLGRGWALMRLDRLTEAERVFEGIVSDPRLGIDARYWLGLAQKAQQHWAAAAETLAAAEAAAGADHELLSAIRFHAGEALLRAGDPAAACGQFDRVIASQSPEDQWADDAMRGKVQAARQLGDHQTLDQQSAEFDRRFPDSPLAADVRRMQARSLLERNKHEPAVRLLELLLSQGAAGPQDLEARHMLALAYQGLGRYEDALAALLPVLDTAQGRLRSDALLTEGSLLVALGRFTDAIGPLEAFLAGDPGGDEHVKGRGELAVCYARSGQLDKARQTYAGLLAEHPQHKFLTPTTEHLAEAAYAAGDSQWAEELSRWLATQGGSQEHELKGMAGLAWSQWKQGQLAQAADSFQQLLDRNPPVEMAVEAAMARGRILQQLDRPDAALAMYELVIDQYPDSQEQPQALLAAARLCDVLQEDRQAAALYERLALQCPDSAEADAVLYEWAWVMDDLGQAADSSGLFEQLRQEHPQSRYWGDATYRLARRALAEKDYSRATQLVSEVLARDLGSAVREHALLLRGQIAAAQGDWDQVREAMAAVAEQFPESPNRLVADYWVAEATYRSRDYQTAGRLLEDLAQRTQGRTEAWLAMIPLRQAQVLAQLNKWVEAYVVASRIQTDFPGFEQQYEVDYLMGRCLASRADFQGARDAYLKVIRSPDGAKTETAAMAQWMIGETYFHQNDYEAALREFLKVEILYAYPTWQAAALLEAGKCRDLLGDNQEADRLYARLMKEYPGTQYAEDAALRMGTVPADRRRSDQPD